ncbi:MAG: Ferric transporter ATP-binding subunit [Dehalococcoidia bacterium]|nr:Ferric transporter ATP-binding subunit [Dehalococcoidia bacterium]
MRKIKVLSIIILALLTVSMACAPQAPAKQSPSSSITPAPIASGAQGTITTSTLPSPTSQGANWEKTIASAKKEGKVTVYTYTFVGDSAIAVSKAFTDRYGIKVEIIAGRGAEQIERLRTEQRMHGMVADVFESASTHGLNAKKMGLTINSKDLPVLQEKNVWVIDPLNFDPDGVALQFTYHLGAPHVNTNLVKTSEEPQSWYDLLNASWKGKIAAPDPTLSTGLYNYLLPITSRGLLRPGFVAELAAQKPVLGRSPRDVADFLARGEYPLGISSTSDSAAFMSEGAPIKALPMKEGIVVSGLAISVVKDSPSPNAARLFANWLLSPEGQQVQAKARNSSGMRKDVPSYFPKGAQITGPLVNTTGQDTDKLSDAFADKLWVDLFKK